MASRYQWRCDQGHEWEATASNVVKNGRWCPECGRKKSDAGRRRYSLDDLHSWAATYSSRLKERNPRSFFPPPMKITLVSSGMRV
ncbi:hypothetical protein [Zhongshania borealis]|uniref:hypothetical protein n=1 Tax=Zhongshania borealis TaxID=889488 RepID=UPI003CD0B9CC